MKLLSPVAYMREKYTLITYQWLSVKLESIAR